MIRRYPPMRPAYQCRIERDHIHQHPESELFLQQLPRDLHHRHLDAFCTLFDVFAERTASDLESILLISTGLRHRCTKEETYGNAPKRTEMANCFTKAGRWSTQYNKNTDPAGPSGVDADVDGPLLKMKLGSLKDRGGTGGSTLPLRLLFGRDRSDHEFLIAVIVLLF